MTTANLPATIHRKLGAIRRRLSEWFIVDGLSRLMVTLAALTFISLMLDRLFRMDVPQRLIMLLLMAGVAGWVIYRRLIVPLRLDLSDDALALAVERRHRELGDGLISALQLSRVDDPRRIGASPQLLAEAIRRGAAAAEGVDFADVLDRRVRNRTMLWGAGAACVMVATCIAFAGTMGTWASRNLLLRSVEWPQETHLHVDGLNDQGQLVVPGGDDLVLRVVAQGVVPRVVFVDQRPADGRGTTEQMSQIGDDRFEATFRNVIEPFTFRVRGNDDVTEYFQVVTVPRPELIPGPEGLVLILDPPDYIATGTRRIATRSGAYEVPAGSEIRIVAHATKPLARARIECGRAYDARMNIAHAPAQRVPRERPNDPDATPDPDDPDAWITYPAGQRKLSVTIRPDELRDGAYGIRFEDTDGLAGKRPVRFLIKVRPDRPPTARAVLRGIGDLVTPRAVIPVAIRAADDYAVTELAMVHQISSGLDETIEPTPPQRHPIRGEGAPTLPARRVEEFEHRFDVQPLGLVPGVTLGLTVEAVDNDTTTRPDGDDPDDQPDRGPKTGQSTALVVKVVTDEDLRAELLRRETEQRIEFERLVKDQRSLGVDAQALRAGLERSGAEGESSDRLSAAQWRAISDLEKKQRLAAGRCEGIAAQYLRIYREVINNRLEPAGGRLQTRLDRRIIQPLTALAAEAIPPIADRFDAARKTTLTADQRLDQLDAAIADQQRLLERMNQILASMVKVEGYQEMVNLLREILRTQQDIEERTIRELERKIEQLFDD
jgi:hypothetical protein